MRIIKKHYLLLLYIGIVILLTLVPYKESMYYDINYNITPLKSIHSYLRHMSNNGLINEEALHYLPFGFLRFFANILTVSFKNLMGNILLFLPLGIFVSRFYLHRGYLWTLLYALIFSGSIEVLQFIFLTSRIADIDDVILNVIGALIGFLLYQIASILKALIYSGGRK